MKLTHYIKSFVLLAVCITATSQAAEAIKASPEKEKELLAILRSEAAPGEKAIACKRLAIDGSREAVPELAKLLPNPQLSSWARTALEVIPGPEADEALRKAAATLEGRLLVGMINSIGVRRDANAVEPLTTRLQDKDAEVASAAAVALGRIGNAAAAKSLRSALASAPVPVRSAVAEGCVLCAEQLLTSGNATAATEIFDEVRKAAVPKQRILEATRGAILARNQAGIPLLLELFRSEDKAMFRLGLTTVREFPGGEVDKALAAELANAKPERAVWLVQAMADRPATVDLAVVLNAAANGAFVVRLSATKALGRIGNASCLPVLLEAAVDANAELAQAAKTTLSDLPGKDVDAQIVTLLSNVDGKKYALLINLVGQRRIDAGPVLFKALDHADAAIRTSALTALGETVDIKGLSTLIAQAVAPKHAEDAAVAEKALKAASVRMPDREACAAELVKAMEQNKSVTTQSTLLQILGSVGGAKALAAIHIAGKSTEPQLQDVATKVLGEWLSDDAAPVLLDLAKTAPDAKYQSRAFRGYLRIARQFVTAESQRIEMCRKAWELSSQPAERKLVLELLQRIPNADALQMAITALAIPELKNDANATILVIAQKSTGKDAGITELLTKAGYGKVKLEIVKAEYGADSQKRDVTAVLRKFVGDLPIITLTGKGGFSGNFGGDPAPGSVKQLKVQYKIDGKDGEATFAEDALIVLPMPK